MPQIEYFLPHWTEHPRLVAKAFAVHDAICRLDERVHGTALGAGWAQRLLFSEALACQLTQGDLVHLEDLVLLDGRSTPRTISLPLTLTLDTLQSFRRALKLDPRHLLNADRPGLEPPATARTPATGPQTQSSTAAEDAAPPVDGERLRAWHAVRRQTADWPPILASVLCHDAWTALAPDSNGVTRASLLAALLLRERGLTRQWLLPIDYGRRHDAWRPHPRNTPLQRIEGLLGWMQSAAQQARTDYLRLAGVYAELLRRATPRQKNSRMPALIDYFIARPLVAAPAAARHLNVSQTAIIKMIDRLSPVPREMTGRARYRMWRVG